MTIFRKARWALLLAVVAGAFALPGTAHGQTAGDIYTPDGATGCTGNNVIQDAPYSCSGARDFRLGQVRWTVRADFSVDAAGNGVAVYTLSRPGQVQTLPSDVPIRVRSHAGISSAPGPLVDDVQGVIPAGSTTATLRFQVVCGQVDVKAVFTDEGDGRGRLAGPYVCTPVPTDTTPTTAPGQSTVPNSAPVTGPTSTTGSATSVVRVQGGALPATGVNAGAVALGAIALVLVGLAAAARARRPEHTR